MEQEIWKDVEGYEGLYQISNLGRIKNYEKIRSIGKTKNKKIYPEGIMKQSKSNKSYFYIIFSKNGIDRTFTVHRLVAKHFIENTSNLPCVNHIDSNKANNNASNLEWVTYSYNSKHAFLNGNQPGAYNSLNNPKCIRVKNLNNNEIYNSIKEASCKLGIKYPKFLKYLNQNKFNFLQKL